MSLIGTDTLRFSNTFKHVYEPSLNFCFERVTINETAARTMPIGTVLGVITANGKYRRVEATAADGSQNAAGVLAQDLTVAANTDAQAIVCVRGPAIVSRAALSFGASVDTDAERLAIFQALAARQILVNDTV